MKNYTNKQLMKAFEEIKELDNNGILPDGIVKDKCVLVKHEWGTPHFPLTIVREGFLAEMARRWYDSRQNISQKEESND